MSHKKIIITALSIAILTGSYFVAAQFGFFGGGTNAPSVPADTMTRGLVGYWEFEEGTGQTAYDISGNSNDGTLGADISVDTDDPKWSKGKNGGALQFDGVNDYVDCGNDASLDITDAITIEAWVKATATDQRGIVFGGDGSWTNAYSFFIRNNTQIGFAFNDAGIRKYYIFGVPSLGTSFHHIAVTYNSGSAKCVLDGVIYTVGVSEDTVNRSFAGVKIGDVPGINSPRYFNGAIDSVRIYNRALTAEEVRYHYNRGGPVASWDFDEGSGTVIYDSSGNEHHGELHE